MRKELLLDWGNLYSICKLDSHFHNESDGVASLKSLRFEVTRNLIAQLFHVQERHPVVLHNEGGFVRVSGDNCLKDFGHGQLLALPEVQSEIQFDKSVADSGRGEREGG